ncbi:hypothetical protein [Roseovarius sp. D22-M7]|uniref:hypothetical protein n=1 Tax=Roseovarius sp. D22-M7 TaxID=3127116 RepID=UPI00300F9B28
MVETGNAIWAWFVVEDHQNRVTAMAAAITAGIAVAGITGGVIWYYVIRRKSPPAELVLPQGHVLTMDQHLTILQKREDQLEAKLSTAHQDEKDLLRRQIADLKAKIAKPEESLAEARTRMADLEALLDRGGNHIGGDRIKEAKAALEKGDYSIADDIFAEIEARNELAVQETARAAYGRGEVSEAEVRWHDAYTRDKRASDLLETFEHLAAYARMTWRLAKGAETVAVHERLVECVRSEHGDSSADYATHLKNLAGVLQAQRRIDALPAP